MNAALLLVLLPFVLVIVAIAIGIGTLVRRRQFTRLRALAPDSFLFTFSSNRLYQSALLELRESGVMDEKTRTDSEDPFAKGPRWIAASTSGLEIRRGWEPEPVLRLTWDRIGAIDLERFVSRGYNSSSSAAIGVGVKTAGKTIELVLASPDARVNSLSGMRQARDVADALNRLRAGKPMDGVA